MASSSSLLCLFSLFYLLSLASSSPQNKSTSITLSLSQFNKYSSPDPWQKLTHLAFASLTRAHHLKNPQNTSLTKTHLFPHSYGGYSISLSFGTPPQIIPFVMETGSSLVWFPCTHRYSCKDCAFPNTDPTKIPSFIPKLSSSSKLLGCRNPKCSWIHDADVQSRCQDCDPNSSNCSQICPPYIRIYGSGTTGGVLLSETLDFPEKRVPDFVVGCSLFSSRQPAGIAGFGRSPSSLPSQLGLNKFSYCLLSHRFDDTSGSSSLVLESGSDSGDHKTNGVNYTPFLKVPVAGNSAFSGYYYVSLRKITVGGNLVKIPYSYLSPGSDGNGGTVVDSGTTFTFMEGQVFELVAREFQMQVLHYKRAADIETRTGLRPCFNVSGDKTISLPKLVFHFKGGAKMTLPLANYFSILGNSGVACMTMVTDVAVDPEFSGGPAIILGNYQQQNFYLEYDLENERFGFRRQSCK
ncbi:hypothetical protein HHK36_019396 [Tetracentron sinense]|uniref:Peptidase A1 domain-containing protein n=1 Tax=Tetracentron sinense TaxID=13715 RepID=A0A834YW65_TETSI|nr:hypothetical protein HHK36_019396 [Tetracentron sinense]